ncbi:MAG: Glutamate--tRNA ligase [Alphaproteobacteria bacterium UBA4588]|nr:MAG: Glutamate--tRNA ligase [Alphaproteobacteria bacterium UBA4588]
MSVVTRFAPSPTGYLHIGGARTALFNALYAAHHGGTYLVRIEDTDKARSTDDAVKAIHDGLAWLGLEGDKPAVMQSTQEARHREAAVAMLDAGTAYRCYLTDEALDTIRTEARAEGKPVRSPYRNPDKAPPSHDVPFVVRLRMPDDGETVIDDLVQGRVTVKNETLDDLVMLRSDGSPTYMLAVVVDDHDMGITHVLRGDDHLNNAFRQHHIFAGLGWQPPRFGHIPLIHGPDGAKLSKRHGALGVDAYREMGFLSEAINNYLCRLGWSHGDDELFSRAEAEQWFDSDGIGKSPARFDMDKLRSVNAHWLRQLSADALADDILSHTSHSPPAASRGWLIALAPLLAERAHTLDELRASAGWLLHDGAPSPDEAAEIILNQEAIARLKLFVTFLTNADDAKIVSLDAFQSAFQEFLAENELKMKDLGLPLRAALTGTKAAPSITDIIVALGRAETVLRLEQICNRQDS